MKRIVLLTLVLVACKPAEQKQPAPAPAPAPVGNAAQGRQLVQQYGCTSCHDIPNVSGPKGMVGPSLEHVGTRQIIAGKLPNTPQNLTAYLQDPQMADPQNAMPNLQLTPQQSKDIAAFLYTLK